MPHKKNPKHRAKFQEESHKNISFKPITSIQKHLWNSLHNNTMIVSEGFGGTGKSFVNILYACKQLSTYQTDKLVITRSTDALKGKRQGYYPGDVFDKNLVWMRQSVNYCKQFLGDNITELWMKEGHKNQKIFLQELETIRGRNFEDSIVLLEEAQNLSIEELIAISTRIGENCQLLITGDYRQSDYKDVNGLKYFCDILSKHKVKNVEIIHFLEDDIVRSGIVKELTKVFIRESLL